MLAFRDLSGAKEPLDLSRIPSILREFSLVKYVPVLWI